MWLSALWDFFCEQIYYFQCCTHVSYNDLWGTQQIFILEQIVTNHSLLLLICCISHTIVSFAIICIILLLFILSGIIACISFLFITKVSLTKWVRKFSLFEYWTWYFYCYLILNLPLVTIFKNLCFYQKKQLPNVVSKNPEFCD